MNCILYIHKRNIYSNDKPEQNLWEGAAELNLDGKVMYVIKHNAEWKNRLHYMFIHIPSPFKFGDIVTVRNTGEPVMLKDIPHWDGQYIKDVEYRHDNNDSYWFNDYDNCIDKSASFYYTGDDALYLGNGINTEDFVYFKGELKGKNRFLNYLKKFLQQESESELYDSRDFSKLFEDYKRYMTKNNIDNEGEIK